MSNGTKIQRYVAFCDYVIEMVDDSYLKKCVMDHSRPIRTGLMYLSDSKETESLIEGFVDLLVDIIGVDMFNVLAKSHRQIAKLQSDRGQESREQLEFMRDQAQYEYERSRSEQAVRDWERSREAGNKAADEWLEIQKRERGR